MIHFLNCEDLKRLFPDDERSKAYCCTSCHVDADEYGYPMCGSTIVDFDRTVEIEVCCVLSPLANACEADPERRSRVLDDVRERAKETG